MKGGGSFLVSSYMIDWVVLLLLILMIFVWLFGKIGRFMGTSWVAAGFMGTSWVAAGLMGYLEWWLLFGTVVNLSRLFSSSF